MKKHLAAKDVKLFALIDHSDEAEKAVLQMRLTKLLIFGKPKAGTPWMVATPSIAIDLPMKILVAEDPFGKVWVSYNDPGYSGKASPTSGTLPVIHSRRCRPAGGESC